MKFPFLKASHGKSEKPAPLDTQDKGRPPAPMMSGQSIENQKFHENLIEVRQGRQNKSLENISDLLFEYCQPLSCCLFLKNSVDDAFALKAYQTSSSDWKAIEKADCNGVFLWIEALRQPKVVHFDADPNLPYYRDSSHVRSLLMVPVVVEGRAVGSWLIDFDHRETFDAKRLTYVKKLVHNSAEILSYGRTLEELKELKTDFTNFHKTSIALNHAFHLQDVLETFLETTKNIIPYDWGCIVLYNKDIEKNMIVLDSDQDVHGLVGETFELKQRKSLVSWVIDQVKMLHLPSYLDQGAKDPVFHAEVDMKWPYESVLILPLCVQNEKIGAVVLAGHAQHFFTPTVCHFLEVVVLQAGIAIKNAIGVSRLKKLATTDGLTKLLNHRSFQQELISELGRCLRYHQPLSLMILDLDFFKNINDQHGHPAGDFVLRKMAAFLQQQVRNSDLVARYGGEEFAVILPNTNAKAALVLAKRMLINIKNETWMFEGKKLSVTFSAGLASVPLHAEDKKTLISNADHALYRAKACGRDQACMYDPTLANHSITMQETQLIDKIEKELV